MSDTEWDGWMKRWGSGGGPLPDVRAHAARQAARHRWGNALLIAIMAGGSLADLWATYTGGLDPVACAVLVVWGVGLTAGVLWLQRGARLARSAGPREAVAFLEARVRFERRAAQLFRWVYAAALLFVGVHFRDLFGDDWQVKLVARLILFAVFVATFTVPWWMRRLTDRQEAELHQWRRWMEEQQL